jgi:hypothetical protein
MYTRLPALRDKFRSDPELPFIGDIISCYFYLFLFFSLFADLWVEEIHLYLLLGLILSLSHLPAIPPTANDTSSV